MRRCKHIEILEDIIAFKKKDGLKYCKLRATLRNLSGCSVLSHSLNTVYAIHFAHPNCAFGTPSHTPKPLSEIANMGKGKIW